MTYIREQQSSRCLGLGLSERGQQGAHRLSEAAVMRFDRRRRLRARELRQNLAHRLDRLRLRRAQRQPFPDNVRLRPAAARATFTMDAQQGQGGARART